MAYSLSGNPTVYSPGQYGMPTYVVYEDDFVLGGKGTTIAGKFATTADAAEWLQTVDNSGTCVIDDANPGATRTMK